MNTKAFEYKSVRDIKRLHFIANTIKKNAPANGRILDIGCGNGIITRYIGEAGYEVVGIDISEETIEIARCLTTNPKVRFTVYDAEKLAADNEQFDAVICSEVLEHLHQPEKLVHTLSKLLKAEGCLIVTVPNGYGPREVFVTRPMQRLQNSKGFFANAIFKVKKMLGYEGVTMQSSASDLTHLQFFTLKQLKKLAQSNKFSITKVAKSNFIEDVFPFSLLTNRVPLLQKIDCKIADLLPAPLTGGFFTVWKKEGY